MNKPKKKVVVNDELRSDEERFENVALETQNNDHEWVDWEEQAEQYRYDEYDGGY